MAEHYVNLATNRQVTGAERGKQPTQRQGTVCAFARNLTIRVSIVRKFFLFIAVLYQALSLGNEGRGMDNSYEQAIQMLSSLSAGSSITYSCVGSDSCMGILYHACYFKVYKFFTFFNNNFFYNPFVYFIIIKTIVFRNRILKTFY